MNELFKYSIFLLEDDVEELNKRIDNAEDDLEDIEDDGIDNDSNTQDNGQEEGNKEDTDEEQEEGNKEDTTDSVEKVEVKTSVNERIIIFKDYKKLYKVIDFLERQIFDFKQRMYDDNINDIDQNSILIKLIDETYKIKENIYYIITNQIKVMDTDRLILLFDKFKEKLEILIELFKQINNIDRTQ